MLPLHSSRSRGEKDARENLLRTNCQDASPEREIQEPLYEGARLMSRKTHLCETRGYWMIGMLAASNIVTIIFLSILSRKISLQPGTSSVFPHCKAHTHINPSSTFNHSTADYESVLFQKDERFVKPPSIESNAAWQSTIPGFVGLMYINDSQRYGLPDGRFASDGTPNVYGVSWTHQYHCLVSLQSEYRSLNPSDTQPERT